MNGLRYILFVFLFAGILLNHGLQAKEASKSVGSTPNALAPNSTIKGRLLTVDEGCGIPVLTSMKRIVGGGPAKEGAWPWLVLLGLKRPDKNDPTKTNRYYGCGGSLITTRHVLTAAHCFSDKSWTGLSHRQRRRLSEKGFQRILLSLLNFVRLGEHDTSAKNDQRVEVDIDRVLMHQSYSYVSHINDIALVYISDVKFTDRIRPICLPTSKDMQNRSFVGSTPFVAGWGHLKETNSNMTNILQQVQLNVIETDKCKEKFNDAGYYTEAKFSAAHVHCTYTDGGLAPCEGDSGGPLMLPVHDNGRFPYFEIGLVSYSHGCGRANIPVVYTNVQRYIDWIVSKLD